MENVSIKSEIGRLRKVIIHEPGAEIELMTPKTSNELLYDDILSLNSAIKEHRELSEILKLHSNVYYIKDLLTDIFQDESVKEELLKTLTKDIKSASGIKDELMRLDANALANKLLIGVEKHKDNLSNFLTNDKYALKPLPNFVYTRDSTIVINEHVLSGAMANDIRTTEATIIHSIFSHHKEFKPNGFYLDKMNDCEVEMSFEGGDILVLREDVLAIGLSERTNTQAIDFLIEKFKKIKQIKHVFAVIMPKERAMIHLDMIFTMIDKNYCVAYNPVLLGEDRLGVVHIDLSSDKQKLTMEDNLIGSLKKVGIELEPVLCGGTERLHQEREQWMCGANFFTMAPGKIIGYGRNYRTFEQLDKVASMPRIEAQDIILGKVNLSDYDRYAIAITGAELSRGGGGARCMTMPVLRDKVNY
ncbi:MAG TPA: arginine deiminase family protein [Candidatus Cloacimonadota bacterium]|jgi:arginine deiminase|nr:arginine deiminase family protein [Candidatus Cloacimonadales bacterium]HPY97140.1 arginine deiminase family protein [Candidatus Cloacimonadota bacterium]HQB41674.1 arginine deiminase family protein [Candidatus Cloacimonadota bacterium]